MTPATHAPADVVAAFRAVGREITLPRAQAVTAVILDVGYEAAHRWANANLTGQHKAIALDVREYGAARIEGFTGAEKLIDDLQYEVALLRQPHPYSQAERNARGDAIEARIGRIVALSQKAAA